MGKRWPPWAPAPWDHGSQYVGLVYRYATWRTCDAGRIVISRCDISKLLVAHEVDPLEGVTVRHGVFIPKAPHAENQ